MSLSMNRTLFKSLLFTLCILIQIVLSFLWHYVVSFTAVTLYYVGYFLGNYYAPDIRGDENLFVFFLFINLFFIVLFLGFIFLSYWILPKRSQMPIILFWIVNLITVLISYIVFFR